MSSIFNFNFSNQFQTIENYPEWVVNRINPIIYCYLPRAMENGTFQFINVCNHNLELEVTFKADANGTPICQIRMEGKLVAFFDFSLVDNPFVVTSAILDICQAEGNPIPHNRMKPKARRLGTEESNRANKPYHYLCTNEQRIVAIGGGKGGHWLLDGRQIANGFKNGIKSIFDGCSGSDADAISQRLGLDLEGDSVQLIATEMSNFDIYLALRTPKMFEFERRYAPSDFVIMSPANEDVDGWCYIPVLRSRLWDFNAKKDAIHRRWHERTMAEIEKPGGIVAEMRQHRKSTFGL